MILPERFPHSLPKLLELVLGQDGKAYSVRRDAGNPYALPVGSRALDNTIREIALREGINLRRGDIQEINGILQGRAEMAGEQLDVWYRVAPVPGGVEIDLGDDGHTRVRVTAGKSEIIASGSESLFYRSPLSLPMALPAEDGDLRLLRNHINLHAVSETLLVAWLSYTLAHPKVPTSKFPILVLNGGQGSGKSSLCGIVSRLVDPSRAGLRLLANNIKDLAIAAHQSHVLCFDNVRGFSQAMADALCVAATGGVLTTRSLYTDADQHISQLHVALVLNGIHSFIDQPDLAQRCLPLQLQLLPEERRRSDAAMAREFEADLPAILRGLLDLIADVFEHLPDVEPAYPERMIDFVCWLAAMEKHYRIPAGIFQHEYSNALRQGQLDSLQDNLIAAAIMELAEELPDGEWAGTPGNLLDLLNTRATWGTQRSREWPLNAVALSKRLIPLQAGLSTQGIDLEFRRGKERQVIIRVRREGDGS